MKRYEMEAARLAGISLEVSLEPGWCKTAREVADFLDQVAVTVPAWKFWVRPGIRLAASMVRGLLEMKCGG